MLRAIAALLAASGAAGLVPTRRSVARVINAGGEEDYVNPVTEFLGRFIPKQAPLELGVDWDQPKRRCLSASWPERSTEVCASASGS